MPRKTDAKDRMIRTSAELFRARGFHGVGLAEILEESGAPKGSFYYHFPGGKDELAVDVIGSGGRFIGKLIDKAFENAGSVDDGVRSLVELIATAFEESGFEMGCPVTSLILDMTPSDDNIRRAGEAVLDHWKERMIENARRILPPEADPKDYENAFWSLLVAIEGGWVVSRMTHSKAPILLACEIYQQALAADGLTAR